MSFIDDLKTLDTKQPGNWPWPIKAAAFVLLFILIQVGAYFLFWQAQADEIEKGRVEVAKQKEVFLEKKKLAVNLEAYKQQRAEIEQSFGALLKQLPNKSEMDALLIDINQAGLGRGLAFELFKPAERENLTEFYAELPVNIKVTGNYHDLGRLRERRGEDAAHRAAHRPQARAAQGWSALHGGGGEDLPIPRRRRSREAAQVRDQGRPAREGQGRRQVMKRLILPLALAVLGGCSSEIDELKAFVRDSRRASHGRVEPLPAVKPFEPFAYEGFDLPDPFKPRKLAVPKEGGAGGIAPDLNRRKEPLEAFPLEQLKMVGTLQQGKDMYALVRADKTLYRVKKGTTWGRTSASSPTYPSPTSSSRKSFKTAPAIGPSGRAFCRSWKKPAKGTKSDQHAPHSDRRPVRGSARRARPCARRPVGLGPDDRQERGRVDQLLLHPGRQDPGEDRIEGALWAACRKASRSPTPRASRSTSPTR
jgi:Tfp pilus assembly protein PilO/Tfp pilus assembly protein PilP